MGNKLMCCTSPQQSQSHPFQSQNCIATSSFQGCNVYLSLGHLFDQDVDTVVVVVNGKMKLGPQTSEYIRKYGGQSVINEQKHVLFEEGGKLDLGQVVHTHAGDMDYEYIFYAVLPSCCDNSMVLHKKFSFIVDNNSEYQPSGSFQENIKLQDGIQVYTNKLTDSAQTHERQNIYECVYNCLLKAYELGIQSIALPILEPQYVHISKSKIVTTMLLAIKSFLKDNQKNKLTEIKIATQDPSTLNLCKFYLGQVLNDQSETTLEFEKKEVQSSSFGSQSRESIQDVDVQKLCHYFKDEDQLSNKHKSSF